MSPHDDRMPLRKVYLRYREDHPETSLHSMAFHGFRTLGIETKPFHWIDDIDGMDDLGPDVGVIGYIGDVHRGLQKLGKPIPPNVDYPEVLRPFLGREVRQGTLEEVRASTSRLFVKPVEHKAFDGFVWEGCQDAGSRRRIVTQEDSVPVWIADPVSMVSEYRSTILDGQIVDCRRYKGDWSVAPNRTTVERAVRLMKEWPAVAYCLDWAVTDEGRTILVEANESYAFGDYGLAPVSYARMLAARWHQMTT